MTVKMKVTWPNAGTTLLPEDLVQITLDVGSTSHPPTTAAKGVREFDVPAGATSVTLSAQFSVNFGEVTLADGSVVPETEKPVWIAEQEYEVVNGTTLVPKGSTAGIKVHPLVETTNASGTNGAVQVRLRTEFVSLGNFWKLYASGTAEWKSDHTKGVGLLVLGYTGGKPLIWFASIPKAVQETAKTEISCLVFYRPSNDTYTRVDQQHSQSRLNRFLLKPDGLHADYWKRDVFSAYFPKGPKGKPELYAYLRAGFEDALTRSGKPVLMLHPWPSGLDFGDAATAKLPQLCEAAIRFLWSAQAVAKKRENVGLGRLGLSGFSAGGQAMYTTLGLIGSKVDEVYSFDANGGNPGSIIQWFNQKPKSRCLRMSGAYQIANHAAIKAAIEKTGGATSRVTALPPDGKGYDDGANPLWDHVLSLLPPKLLPVVRARDDYRHQFAIFGDFTSPSGASATTFLLRFLNDSDF
jgi:hypothetical protein